MSKKIYLSLSIVAVLVSGIIILLSLEKTTVRRRLIFTETSSLTATQIDLTALATTQAERTAIAIFTLNPTLALSSTPFYAQIIYNDVIRNLTEVPFPTRPCYINPTNAPQNSATPIKECGPFIGTMMLGDESRKIMALMEKAGIQGTAGITSYGLEGIGQSFVAVRSQVGIWIDVSTITDQHLINDKASQLIDILMQNWTELKYLSNDADIVILIGKDNQNRELLTTYATLYVQYQKGLNADDLIESLGGFKDTH